MEGQQQTTLRKNLRSSKREEVDQEENYDKSNSNEHKGKKKSATQESEAESTLLTTRDSSGKGKHSNSFNEKTKNTSQNEKSASWEDQLYQVRDLLATSHSSMLDEDEVVSRLNRVVRSATLQFHAAKSLVSTTVNDNIVFESCYEEAQDQAVIDDLLKEIASVTALDRRAVSWIKRTIGASGRRQKSKHNLLLGNTKRRLTRGMTKAPNGTKSEDILYDAVREIEREKNMRTGSGRRLSASSYNADDEGNRHKSIRQKRRLDDEHSVRCFDSTKPNAFTILILLLTDSIVD